MPTLSPEKSQRKGFNTYLCVEQGDFHRSQELEIGFPRSNDPTHHPGQQLCFPQGLARWYKSFLEDGTVHDGVKGGVRDKNSSPRT